MKAFTIHPLCMCPELQHDPPPPPLLVFMVSRVTGHPVVPSRMIYSNIISKTHSHPQLLGTSYKVSEIISLKKFAIFMHKGKQYIMLTLYKYLLEMMTQDNNASTHMSTHKNIHIFRYNTCIKLGTNLIKPEHTQIQKI